jgi:hypothetical protein
MTLPRGLLLLLAVALIALMLTAGPVFAAPGGNGHGIGQGTGGGNAAHIDSSNHTATGGGQLNDPHLDDCGPSCTPF